MKNSIFLTCLIGIANLVSAQWTNTYNGQGDFSDVFNVVAADASGNSFQAGYTINPDLSKDILLVKLNNSGDTVWTRIFNGLGNGPDEAIAMTIDNGENILLTGYQKGSGTGYDIVTLKYNTDGNLLWTATYNYTTNEFDQGNAIITDDAGNVYVAGQSDKDVTLNNNDDYLVVKYNSAGIQQWVKRTNGLGNSTDRPSAITLDGDGNLFVTGRSDNGADDDYFTVKYNGSTGVELWKNYYDRTHHDRATDIVCNTTNGRVYITGRSGNGDNYDYATICYDGSGTEIWQGIFDYVDDDRATQIGIDNSGNIYVTGQSDVNASAIGINYDILTVKYNSSGVLQFSQSFGSADGDDIPAGMVIDAGGLIYIAGSSDQDASADIENDITTLCYNSTGTLQWSTTFSANTSSNDIAKGITINSTGKIITCGYSENIPNKDAVALQLTTSGTNNWDYAYNGIGDNADNVHAIYRDNSNNVYLAGYTFGYEQDRNFMVMKLGASGTQQWIKTINGSSNTQSTDDALAIAQDNSGNIYAAGFVKNSGTGYDMMLAKYSAAGDSLWAQQYNYDAANETDKAVAIAIDAENNIYVTGRSDQDATIISNDDVVTLKYTASGVLSWEKRYNGGGNGLDNSKLIRISDAGNIFVCGKTFNGSNLDMLLIKYNTAGVQQWAKTFDRSSGDDEAISMVIDAEENIYVAGQTTSANNDLDVTLLAYNTSGALQYSKHYDSGSTGNDETKSISIDAENNLVIAATTASDTDALTLNGDITVIKFDINGNVLWDETFANELNDDASEAAVDANNNIIVTGQTDNGTGGLINYDYVTLKYSSDGILNETEVFNGTGNASDVPNTLLAFENEIYVTGGSYGSTSQRDIVTILYGTTPEHIFNNNITVQLNIYPNPATTNITVALDFASIANGTSVELSITDISGRIVKTISCGAEEKLNINCANLPAGTYLLNVISNNKIVSTNTFILN